MKLLKTLTAAAVMTMSMAGGAHAETVLNDWVFNPTGGGFATGQQVNEYLDVNGNSFIQLNPTGTSSFSFAEHGVFNIVQADSNSQLFPVNYPGGNITATFEATGSGSFGGAFSFTGGTIRMYQNPTDQYGTAAGIYGADLGNLIAEFSVLAGGGGRVDASGSPTNNGQITVLASAAQGGLDAGYFFRENGTDLSTESILAFAFTNANTVGDPDDLLVDEVACQYANFSGNGCNGQGYANTPGAFFVSNNGQLKLGENGQPPVDVPEPGSLALFGIALLGAGAIMRKRGGKA